MGQPKCPSAGYWLHQLWCVHPVEASGPPRAEGGLGVLVTCKVHTVKKGKKPGACGGTTDTSSDVSGAFRGNQQPGASAGGKMGSDDSSMMETHASEPLVHIPVSTNWPGLLQATSCTWVAGCPCAQLCLLFQVQPKRTRNRRTCCHCQKQVPRSKGRDTASISARSFKGTWQRAWMEGLGPGSEPPKATPGITHLPKNTQYLIVKK